MLLCRVELLQRSRLFIHLPSNTYHIHLAKCVLFCLKMPPGPVAWSQHCIMTALAVAYSVVSRSEWKRRLCRRRHCWLHLEQFGHSTLMLQRCGQVNNAGCVLKANYLFVMSLYKAGLVPFNHANPQTCLSAPLSQQLQLDCDGKYRQNTHGQCLLTAVTKDENTNGSVFSECVGAVD